MPSYDSDSSGAEDNGYEETNVLLGYASTDANGEEISRLGGRPEWIDSSKPPSASLARCKVCKDLMVLLLQLNAELPDRFPGHERRLYVLSCRKKSCRRQEGSMRTIRGLRVLPEAVAAPAAAKEEAKKLKETAPAPLKASSAGLGEALFGVKPATSGSGSANPFAGPSSNPLAPKSSAGPANPFVAPKLAVAEPLKPTSATAEEEKAETEKATQDLPKTFAETLALNAPPPPAPPKPEPWPEESAQPTPYPVRWLADAEYETLDPEPAPVHANTQVMDVEDGTSGSGGGKEDKEVFESTMDSVFQKFADRVGQNPEQCIRYEFAGQPLLYSKSDAVGKFLHTSSEKIGPVRGIPKCGNCGSARVFEAQLTPHAIQELESEEDDMDGMDWGTVIVGVCERDCQQRFVEVGEAGYVEEWCGVQWEELSVKR